MDKTLAERLVAQALDKHYSKDSDLPHDVSERCRVHRVAVYLEELLRDDGQPWSVDCEYNRDRGEPKRPASLIDQPTHRGRRRGDATPDIVVHKRGSGRNNLIAIEVKPLNRDTTEDEQKLRAYFEDLDYRHAILLLVGPTRDACSIRFVASR